MSEQKYKLLVWWYRLTGSSQVQAEWKARRAVDQAQQTRDGVSADVARVADRRYKCLCGQLLTVDDKTCHACGRKQRMPPWARNVTRALGLVVPDVAPATIFIMALIVLGYGVQVRVGGGGLMSPVQDFKTLFALGAYIGPDLWRIDPATTEVLWRSFTYSLLHGGLMHIGFNTFALFQIGPLVEERFGSGRLLFAWVLTAAGAVLLPPLLGFGRGHPIVGASGAVFGLIGMAMVQGHRQGDASGRAIRDVMIRWTIYTTLFGLFMNVAHTAHFGGLAVGGLLALVLPPAGDSPSRRALGPALGVVAVGLMGAALYGFWIWWREIEPLL